MTISNKFLSLILHRTKFHVPSQAARLSRAYTIVIGFSTMSSPISVLDAAGMANGTPQERAEFGQKFLAGMTEHGFVKLVNHSVPLPLVGNVFDKVRYFQLALAQSY